MSNLLNDILALKSGQSVILKDFHVLRRAAFGFGYLVTHKNATSGEKFRCAADVVVFLEKQPSPPQKETMPINSDLIESLSPGWSTDIQGFKIRRNTDGSYSVFKKGIAQGWAFQEAHELVTFLESPPPEYLQVWGRATRAPEATCPPPYGYVNTDGLAKLCQDIHRYNVDAGWWTNIETGERLDRNVPEMLMLIVSEISEAMEGYRKNLMDDKLPHRKMIEVELADAVIRICDTAEGLGLDLAGAVREKIIFNTSRPDHKIENRLKENGKKF